MDNTPLTNAANKKTITTKIKPAKRRCTRFVSIPHGYEKLDLENTEQDKMEEKKKEEKEEEEETQPQE